MAEKPAWQIFKPGAVQAGAAEGDGKSQGTADALDEAEFLQETVKGKTAQEPRTRDHGRQSFDQLSAKVVPEDDYVQRVKFPAVQAGLSDGQALEKIDYLRDVDLEVGVELGNTILSINKILSLDVGSVVELNQTVGEEVRILINGNPYALGEVVVIGEKFGVRLTRIIHERGQG